jgi:hypothetical protein
MLSFPASSPPACLACLPLQDGTIEHEIKLTGILSTSVLSPGEAAPTHGTMVAPLVNAAAHQHLFSARLDMAVDDEEGGRQLVVAEVGAGRRQGGGKCVCVCGGGVSVNREPLIVVSDSVV